MTPLIPAYQARADLWLSDASRYERKGNDTAAEQAVCEARDGLSLLARILHKRITRNDAMAQADPPEVFR